MVFALKAFLSVLFACRAMGAQIVLQPAAAERLADQVHGADRGHQSGPSDAHGGHHVNETLIESARLGLYSVQRASLVQGTAMSAILDLESGPKWSIYSNRKGGPVYSRQRAKESSTASCHVPLPPLGLYNMAYHAVSAQDQYGRLCSYVSAEEQLAAGASLDSSNCASGVLIAAFADGEIVNGTNNGGYYADAAAKELEFVVNATRRSDTGAISQRNAGIQIWSDSFYMGSSLGFYGMV
jgi:hypothetical protein